MKKRIVYGAGSLFRHRLSVVVTESNISYVLKKALHRRINFTRLSGQVVIKGLIIGFMAGVEYKKCTQSNTNKNVNPEE
jgi:hypothetical protein